MNSYLAIVNAAAEFPETFGLRAFPGEKFRVSISASYVSDGQVMLYTDVWSRARGEWQSFAKGTPAELRAQICK